MRYEDAKREFIKLIESYAYRYRAWMVFSDFCKMAAISLYQPFIHDERLEEEYLEIVSKYEKEDVEMFPRLLSLVIEALSDRMGDFLGECFMDLNLGEKYKGQFFTPYHISKLMASIVGEPNEVMERVSEPAVGSGGMLIARADVIFNQYKIDYQQRMEVHAVDVDALCVYMCYIQLTLLNISAEVVHGNSLTNEVFKVWYTPAYIMRASSRQAPLLEKRDEEVKIVLPDDGIKNKILYNKEELEVFATGRLF
jgi:type I restriction-modification system DNA methylase subunit